MRLALNSKRKKEIKSSLERRAALYLEDMHISGDTIITMDHSLDDITEEQQGAYYLTDLLAGFVQSLSETFS